jgi:hypothetical protein
MISIEFDRRYVTVQTTYSRSDGKWFQGGAQCLWYAVCCLTSGEAVLRSTPRSLMSSSRRPRESSSRLLAPCRSLASSAASTLRI